nr:LacI family DNA-binding transcriptional regulator [Actibacterium sp. 188UL27-1]
MSRKVTSMDVAAQAGVSQSAVSRVFTPGASVSPGMAAKVRAAAAELGYRPNALARGLITGRSKIIGLVVAYLENQFYPDVLEKLSNALQDKGYHILIFMARGRGPEADRVMQELIDYQVDGLIAASVGLSDELIRACQSEGIPVVLFNRGHEDGRCSKITSANIAGGARIARFLVAGGHQRIAHISGWDGSSTGRDRKAGFLAGLDQAGLAPLAIADGLYERETAAQIVRDWWGEASRPDAIFVGNDHMAVAALDVLRFELGVDVPGDVSIVGYDDVPLAAWPAYDLTTLRQPVNQMVTATVDLLLSRIEEPELDPKHIEIDGPLIVRASARKPEDWDE